LETLPKSIFDVVTLRRLKLPNANNRQLGTILMFASDITLQRQLGPTQYTVNLFKMIDTLDRFEEINLIKTRSCNAVIVVNDIRNIRDE